MTIRLYRKLGQIGLITWSVWSLLGCASWSYFETSNYHDSELRHLNPAPLSMTPTMPSSPDEGDPTLDPLYLNSQADFHYTMGEALSLDGHSDKAIEEFKLALLYDSKSITLRTRLASEYVRQGLLSEAIDQVSQAVEADPDSESARFLLAGLYASLKMFDAAIQQYQEYLDRHPENAEAPLYIGAILAEQKKYDEAISYFLRITRQFQGGNPERAYYYIGRIRVEQGSEHYKEAETAFSNALKIKPEYADAVLAWAALMKEQGRELVRQRLLESFQLKFGPHNEIAHHLSKIYLDQEKYIKAYEQLEIIESLEKDNINVRVQMAMILIKQERYEDAIIRLEDVLAQSPDLDKVRYYLGAIYEEVKKLPLAVQNYNEVPPSSGYFLEAKIHTAEIYKRLGQHTKAVEAIHSALELRDDIPALYAYYATLLDDLKQYKKAQALLKKGVEKFPNHAQLHFFLGSIEDRLGDHEATITHMKRVLEIDSNHVQAMNFLAYTYAEQNLLLDEAEALARRALTLKPNDGYILDTVGWVLFKKGDLDVATRYLEAAFKAKSDEAIIAEHLGDVYFRQQLIDKARFMYKKAMELEPEPTKLAKLKNKVIATQHQDQNMNRLPASNEMSRGQ